MRKRVLAPIFKVRFHWRKPMKKLVSVALLRVSASVITKIRQRKHTFPSRKRYGNIQKVVRFRRIRSHGNMNKRHESATGNTCQPLCFRNVVTCFRKISVCGFLAFRPVQACQTRHLTAKRLKTVVLERTCDLSKMKALLEYLVIFFFDDRNVEVSGMLPKQRTSSG